MRNSPSILQRILFLTALGGCGTSTPITLHVNPLGADTLMGLAGNFADSQEIDLTVYKDTLYASKNGFTIADPRDANEGNIVSSIRHPGILRVSSTDLPDHFSHKWELGFIGFAGLGKFVDKTIVGAKLVMTLTHDPQGQGEFVSVVPSYIAENWSEYTLTDNNAPVRYVIGNDPRPDVRHGQRSPGSELSWDLMSLTRRDGQPFMKYWAQNPERVFGISLVPRSVAGEENSRTFDASNIRLVVEYQNFY